MKSIYIYKLTDPLTQEIRYIGKTTNISRRFNAHINRCTTKKIHSAVWIKSLIDKGVKPIIEIIESCDENNWEEREIYWIKFYKEKYDLTNILPGGGNTATYGRLGKPWTEQQRINNRKARLGMRVIHTEESNKKRAEGVRKYNDARKTPVYQYSLDGIFLRKWDSAVDAQNELGIKNILRVCKSDRHKMSGGYIWSFKNNEDYQNDRI